MDGLFQAPAAGGIGEDRGSERFLVDRSVRFQHLRAEQIRDRPGAGLTRAVQVGDQGVRVRDDAAQLGQHRADRRLAAGDAAGETHS